MLNKDAKLFPLQDLIARYPLRNFLEIANYCFARLIEGSVGKFDFRLARRFPACYHRALGLTVLEGVHPLGIENFRRERDSLLAFYSRELSPPPPKAKSKAGLDIRA